MHRALTALITALAASAASAEPITVGFTGSVDEVDEGGGLNLSSEFSVGEPVTGSFTFEDSVLTSGFENQGLFVDAVVDLSMTVGDYEVTTDPAYAGNASAYDLETNNDNLNGPFQGDHIRIRLVPYVGPAVAGGELAAGGFGLSDEQNIVFPDDPSTQSLTPTLDFAEFETGSTVLFFAEPSTGPIGGVGACVGCPDSDSGLVRITFDSFFVVPAPACDGDVDGDGDTDVFDFADLASNFGAGPNATRQQGDLTGDGNVDVFDFGDLASDFGCGSN